MGQEISTTFFDRHDFRTFGMRLREETAHLSQWFRDGRFADEPPVGGFEVEAWLIDAQGRPAPINKTFLERLDDPLVVTELAKFNVELNTPPQPLTGAACGWGCGGCCWMSCCRAPGRGSMRWDWTRSTASGI